MNGRGQGVGGGASGDEAAWRELIANFGAEPAVDGAEPPWPDRENLAAPRQAGSLAGPGPDTDPAMMLGLSDETDPGLDLDDPELDLGPGFAPDRGGATGPAPGPAPDAGPRPGDVCQPRIVRPASAVPPPAEDGEFVPPEPPPLPPLDPVTKAAWAALFGGPAYLLIATMASWTIPGWAAFLAVAAFVGGFAALVIRMGDRPPRDSGPDDGAVL